MSAAKSRGKELLERAKQTIKDGGNYSPHEIANAQQGWGYYYIPHDVNLTMREWYRTILDERGYEPVSEDDVEYVPSDGNAELWRCPPEVEKLWADDRRDFVRCEGRWDGQGSHPWGLKIWKELQRQRNLRQPLER